MRPILLLAAALALPWAAFAQTTAPPPPVSNPAAGPAFTPAPVPSVPPGTPQTGAPTIPPEQIAPADRAGSHTPDAGPANATPFSGAPATITPGTGGTATDRAPSSASGAPPLSK